MRITPHREVPAVGIGTWNVGDDPHRAQAEIDAIRVGLDAGLRVVDTAEMYGSGRSEELVGRAIAGRRDQVFLVSKVLPSNASRRGTVEACRASLRRLGTDHLDLYLLHWRGRHPLAETVTAMSQLVDAGEIAAWGVSNLDPDDMAELLAAGGSACATDQILYNPLRRGPELDLLPWLAEHDMSVIAYSPLEQGELLRHPAAAVFAEIAAGHGVEPAAVALAWAVRAGNVCAIPKATTLAHARTNVAAAHLVLSEAEVAAIDAAYPPPEAPVPLAVI